MSELPIENKRMTLNDQDNGQLGINRGDPMTLSNPNSNFGVGQSIPQDQTTHIKVLEETNQRLKGKMLELIKALDQTRKQLAANGNAD